MANTFDALGRLTQVEAANAGTLLSRYSYTLDAGGRRTGLDVRRGAGASLVRRYTWAYDDVG